MNTIGILVVSDCNWVMNGLVMAAITSGEAATTSIASAL